MNFNNFLNAGLKTDKITHHGYHRIYPWFLEHFRSKNDLAILEIGAYEMGSVYLWLDYFPGVNLTIADIEKKDFPGIECVQLDQSKKEDLLNFANGKKESFDIIVDDGSHVIHHQQISLATLFPYLRPNGQYWIEDLHTSDGSVWQGKTLYGYDMSFNVGESTVDVLESFEKTGTFRSPFLTDDECSYITHNAKSCRMFVLPTTFYGINKLNLITKKG